MNKNIAEIINLKEFPKPMIDPLSPEKDILDNDNNRQNFLSLIDRVIFQKWHTEITLVINKEFFYMSCSLVCRYLLSYPFVYYANYLSWF